MRSKYLFSSILTTGFALLIIAIISIDTTNQDFQKFNNKSEDSWKPFSLSSSPIALNSILEESIEIPNFQVNSKLLGSFDTGWIPSHLDPRSRRLNSTIFKKSIPLFDVKTTYFHFFYSW